MKKVVEINQCMKCHYYRVTAGTCWKLISDMDETKYVKDPYSIPDWCPLPDVQEYCEANFDIDQE